MQYSDLIAGLKQYGSTDHDICVHGLGIPPEDVRERVVIAPWWEPSTLPDLGKAEYLSPSDHAATKVWNVASPEFEMTFIKTGIGAPVLMDSLLSLGVTCCKQIVFIGSVGALDAGIRIGDIVVPEYSVCGDGASRYIASEALSDVFGEKAYPDRALFERLQASTRQTCAANGVGWHVGKTFSVDTIFAQYAHVDRILAMGCNVIEMETSAAFRAAALMKIPLAALFSVSDNTVLNKSLVCGRTDEEMEYRRFTRRVIFPSILLDVLTDVR